MCFCDKLNDEVCDLTNILNCLTIEMRELQDLYIKKNEQKEELINNINYKKNQINMINEWSKLNLEDKRSIIEKISN